MDSNDCTLNPRHKSTSHSRFALGFFHGSFCGTFWCGIFTFLVKSKWLNLGALLARYRHPERMIRAVPPHENASNRVFLSIPIPIQLKKCPQPHHQHPPSQNVKSPTHQSCQPPIPPPSSRKSMRSHRSSSRSSPTGRDCPLEGVRLRLVMISMLLRIL